MPRAKTIEQLRRELEMKTKMVDRLQARRARVLARLEGIDRQIALLIGTSLPTGRGRRAAAAVTAVAARKGKRAPRAGSLPSYIQQVLQKAGKPMRAKDVMEAVGKSGYKTASKDFYGIVATALRDSSRFKKVKRGVYTLA